jgi:hypothetical protein
MKHEKLLLGALLLCFMGITYMTSRVAPVWMVVLNALMGIAGYWWVSFILRHKYPPNLAWLIPSAIRKSAKRTTGSIHDQLHANAPGRKQPTESEIATIEPQHIAVRPHTDVPRTGDAPLKIASDSPWGTSPDVRSAREILFAHIAQERANLIARNSSDEIVSYLDQFSARLAARFDKQ